jgi:hypothetical protein
MIGYLPSQDPESISKGRDLWHSAQLTANGSREAPPIRAHCSDCHTQDGRDLKYFNFSNASIIARSRFHGLSELQGQQIASYIRSLTLPNPGRPWNPPYQPGPGLDTQPVANWAAGAGLSWVLGSDVDTLPFIFGENSRPRRLSITSITANAFRPDGNLNPREIPIAMQLPDWNHWLPRVHPLDFRGAHFDTSTFSQLYQASDYRKLISTGNMGAFFDKWTKARGQFLTPHLASGSKSWTPEVAEAFYAAQLWQLVKTWEVMQKFNLEGRPQQFFGAIAEPRSWLNSIPAKTAPAAVNIPDGRSGVGGSALTNEYFNSSWYEVQLLVNSGNHQHHGRRPMDWLYIVRSFLDLQQESDRPEPSRLLIAVIKAMQSTDPSIGPDNIDQGWRPDYNIDPRLMIDQELMPVFRILPGDVRLAITESMLTAWLDKTMGYPPRSYFQVGVSKREYVSAPTLQNIFGGKAWEAASQFQTLGVDNSLIQRLENWGKAYTTMAERFHY